MLGPSPAEEIARLMAESQAEERKRANLAKHTPRWIQKIADSDPEVQRLRNARTLLENLIVEARVKCGLVDLRIPGPLKRGRPARAKHPLPRRDAPGFDPAKYLKEHKEKHIYYYQRGCSRCYTREYLYFQHHPDERPKGVETAGTDEQGRVRAEQFGAAGWDPVKYPFKA